MGEKIKEPVRFVITGTIVTVVQYAVYWALYDIMSVAAAWTLAYMVSFCCNYVLTTYFTFHVKPTRQRAVSFACGHVINWSLQMALLHFFIWVGCDKSWAPLPMYVIVMPINFFVIKFFVKRIGTMKLSSLNREGVRTWFKSATRLKKAVDWIIMNPRLTRPRWYIRLLAPLYQHRARSSKIYSSVRMDTPPYRKFSIGKRSVVESYSCINNAVGDVIIGDYSRIGLHSTVIGPVNIGSHVILAQGITLSGLNHNYSDPDATIDSQVVETSQITIEDDVWIGANAVVTAGNTIGHHSVVAAGAIVTHDVPPHSLVAGVPAKVVKKI